MVGFCPDVGCRLVSSVCICFIPSGVAILLLLFLWVLISFVSFFVGLLAFLRLWWLLLRCVFLHVSGLLLLWFLCSGSAGLSYHSFPHPSFLLALFVLPLLFSSSASAASFYALWSSPVALFLAVAFISSGFRLRFWHFPFLGLILPRFLPSFAFFLGLRSLSQFPVLRILLAVLRYFWFSSDSEVFPFVCSFSFFPVVSDSVGYPVPFATWSPFGSSQVLLCLFVPLSSWNSFWCSFPLRCGLVVFL